MSNKVRRVARVVVLAVIILCWAQAPMITFPLVVADALLLGLIVDGWR